MSFSSKLLSLLFGAAVVNAAVVVDADADADADVVVSFSFRWKKSSLPFKKLNFSDKDKTSRFFEQNSKLYFRQKSLENGFFFAAA